MNRHAPWSDLRQTRDTALADNTGDPVVDAYDEAVITATYRDLTTRDYHAPIHVQPSVVIQPVGDLVRPIPSRCRQWRWLCRICSPWNLRCYGFAPSHPEAVAAGLAHLKQHQETP